jgi:hypothetical protein
MTRGITISNYLATGDPEGVIFTYMSNWTGQAIKIPRNLFSSAKDFNELKRPGIYFLIGQDENNPDDKLVYVGEANNLSERLVTHLRDNDKSFVETIICLSSKDENLTVSHTKYLEQKTISRLLGSKTEYRLVNRKEGNMVNLPKMVQDEMDTYYDNMEVLLPTLGFNLLHKIVNIKEAGLTSDENFKLDIGGFKANGKLTSNGIEVLKGSEMNVKETPSLSGSYSNLRKTLLGKNIIKEQNGKFVFIDNYEFPSSSTAAAIILGYSVNGRVAWKNNSGKTLKEIEELKISEL